MKYYEVSPVGIVRQNAVSFTYHADASFAIGSIVVIEVGKKERVGVVLAEQTKPDYDTKAITSRVAEQPLPLPLVSLAGWLSDYYATHLGLVWQTLLPRGITKKRRQRTKQSHSPLRERTHFLLNEAQQAAVRSIEDMSPGSALLHGVTGSGKTAVYIQAAKQALARGQSVIVLTPEIGLTSQLVDEFSQHFDDVLLTHSKQTEAERHVTWQAALGSTTPRIAIGPRSALFLPLKHVGLIVIDEAHEPSYKQEQSPRYSALRAASVLAREHSARVVLGSATPLVADYFTAQQSGRPIIQLPHTARSVSTPDIQIIDMTKRASFKSHPFLSDALLSQLETTFAEGKQALIFHNRRGSASMTLCENCGWQAGCPRCFVPLTLHSDSHQLRCHICGLTDRVPTSCPTCGDVHIVHKGIGTKRIEAELKKRFPKQTIVRFDGDSDPTETIQAAYQQLYDGSIDLIIGTQVVAKGLDLPHLRTVGVVQADAGLSLPDYSASERTFQLLSQAIGRVGRNEHATTAIIQSYQPDHPAVTHGLAQDYAGFYEYTLKERARATFPPYTFLLKLTCVYKTEAAAIRNAKQLARELRAVVPSSVTILGPTPSFYERQHDTYRWQLVLKSSARHELVAALAHVPQQHWHTELDPLGLL